MRRFSVLGDGGEHDVRGPVILMSQLPKAVRQVCIPFCLALSLGAPAHAIECDGVLSPCFDANNLDLPAGPAHFVGIEDATALPTGKLSLALAGSYLRTPAVLNAPSPAPSGREVRLVEDVYQLDLLFAIGVLANTQLGLAFPVRVFQDGTGIEGASSRIGGELRQVAVVDPRIGLGYQFLDDVVAAKLRLEAKIPLGDEDAFAGGPGPEFIPALVASSTTLGDFRLAAEASARFRESVRLSDARLGNQLRFALGARYAIWDELSVGAEAWLVPSLVEQPETRAGSATVLPAEWLGSLEATLTKDIALLVAAGTGIPLSEGPGDDADHDRGVTTPLWRAFLSIRVTESGPAEKSGGNHLR